MDIVRFQWNSVVARRRFYHTNSHRILVKSMQRNMNCEVVIPRVESTLRIFSDKMNGIKCCQRLSINQWTRLILTDRVYLSSP